MEAVAIQKAINVLCGPKTAPWNLVLNFDEKFIKSHPLVEILLQLKYCVSFIGNLVAYPAVKESLKSVKIWRSSRRNSANFQ